MIRIVCKLICLIKGHLKSYASFMKNLVKYDVIMSCICSRATSKVYIDCLGKLRSYKFKKENEKAS